MIGEYNIMIDIRLTKEEAESFVLFRKYQDKIETLINNDVFDTKSGSVIIHFNLDGRIMKIDKNEVLFFLKNKNII